MSLPAFIFELDGYSDQHRCARAKNTALRRNKCGQHKELKRSIKQEQIEPALLHACMLLDAPFISAQEPVIQLQELPHETTSEQYILHDNVSFAR